MGLNKKNISYDQDLRQRVGHDATSDFESDPRFTNNVPTANASSENLTSSRDEENLTEESDTTADGVAGSLDSMSASDAGLEPGAQSGRARGNRKTSRQAA